MELQERISAIVEYSNMNLSEFSRHAGFKTPQAVRELLKGNTKTLSDSAFYKLTSAFPNINPDWLKYGEGEMLNVSNSAQKISNPKKKHDVVMVPLVHIDSVGGVSSPNEFTADEQYIEELVPFPGARHDDRAIYQSGTSMSPTIPPGSILQVRRVDDWQEYLGYGNVYVLWLKDDRRITKLVKRFDPDPRNYILCCSYNPDADEEELPRSFIREVWKVINVLVNQGW